MSRTRRAVGVGLSVLLVGLELWAVLGPWESWPFTSAPMFARYQARGAPVYYLEWWVLDGGERRLLSPQRGLGLGELPFRRGYFAAYYGSADPRHPGGHFPGDSEASFVARQSEYCRRLAAAWAHAKGMAAPPFELVISEEVGGRNTLTRTVGRCENGVFRRPP